MIDVGSWAPQAVAKLEKERKTIKSIPTHDIGRMLQGKNAADAKVSLMADAILRVLKDFCEQSEEFSEAVVKGGSFVDCMKSMAKDLGNYAEGLSCCKKAVEFYLPAAEIKLAWSITLPNKVEKPPVADEKPKSTFMLDLESFF